ncbi:MAG: 23S rRNA (guanosine(2251)-2'-O)-methyltransferase RlmB [Muribaculaceae bacterium]|nr:23S rRNA (guanosine(2251)-2'-O)-methyltransferase RlmB [Muribaculaceae bacterium]MDE6643356.1 23S rRNA (guanosine(2251)-2'-O)-methyltransferase RlmB [Muribaculaceae bacterium]
MEKSDYIFGIRAVIEAIEAGRDIDCVLIKKDLSGDLAAELMALIKQYGIVTRRVPIERINRITRKNHQGVVAMLSAVTYNSLENIVPMLYEEGRLPFMVLLDGLTDVRNFGAIARTCECAGVDAIVIPERDSVSVNADAVKTSAGALLHIPVCRERSILGAVKFLKENGYQIIAATEKAEINYTQADFTVPVAIVMGSEDVGISNEVLRQADTLVAIPQFGKIGSLNVSVAAGVMIYEGVRQRLGANLEVI